jgi:hypothetical protein
MRKQHRAGQRENQHTKSRRQKDAILGGAIKKNCPRARILSNPNADTPFAISHRSGCSVAGLVVRLALVIFRHNSDNG